MLPYFALIVILLSIPGNAFAYIDPGTGSLIVQVLIAGILGMGFALRTFWGRICSVFAKFFSGKNQEQ